MMKIFLMISILLMSCSKSERYYSENCQVIDTVSKEGYKKYGRKGTGRTLKGIYTYQIYRCSVSTFNNPTIHTSNIITNESVVISFDPDKQILK